FLSAGPDIDGPIADRVLTSALVVEMIHTATLIHDDIIDHSLLRRGMGTINARWDRKTAVLMGDYLFARAFSTLVHATMPDVVTIMADVTYELSQGELIQEQVVFQPDLVESDYFQLIELKTSALIGAACEIGGVVAGIGGAEQKRLRGFGRKLGLVYQIVDDILDFVGDEALMGKPVHTDLAQGKVTLPLILAFERATDAERRRTEDLFEEGLSRREPADGQPRSELDGRPTIPWHEVEEIVNRHEGVNLARGRVAALADEVRIDLNELATEGLIERLEPILDYVLSRDR
ncbi:MAG: hypothetical protein CME06_14730, partial [Gemmatimonadetes bacterium]|nr:hypothetical protein [Gemmatimonadota bacterium]